MLKEVLISAAVLSSIASAEMRNQPLYPRSLHSIEYFKMNDSTDLLTPTDTCFAKCEMVTDSATNELKERILTNRISIAGNVTNCSYYTPQGEWIEDVYTYLGYGNATRETWHYDNTDLTAHYSQTGKRQPSNKSSSQKSAEYDESGNLLRYESTEYYNSGMNQVSHYQRNSEYFYSENRIDSVKTRYNYTHTLVNYYYKQFPQFEEITIKTNHRKGDSTWSDTDIRKLCTESDTLVIHYLENSEIDRSVKTSYDDNNQVIEVCTMNSTGDTVSLVETLYTSEGYIQETKSSSLNEFGELEVQEMIRYRYKSGATALESASPMGTHTPQLSVSREELKIQLSEAYSGSSSVSVIDIKGRIISESSFNSAQMNLDIKTLASGVYFVTIKNAGSAVSLKFMK